MDHAVLFPPHTQEGSHDVLFLQRHQLLICIFLLTEDLATNAGFVVLFQVINCGDL
jgi:hypothetical protein